MGFDAAMFVGGVCEGDKCALCGGVLDNPVRAPCGHVFCLACLLPRLARQPSCPRDGLAATPAQLTPDRPQHERILSLRVRCDFAARGCAEVLRLTELADHARRCHFRPAAGAHASSASSAGASGQSEDPRRGLEKLDMRSRPCGDTSLPRASFQVAVDAGVNSKALAEREAAAPILGVRSLGKAVPGQRGLSLQHGIYQVVSNADMGVKISKNRELASLTSEEDDLSKRAVSYQDRVAAELKPRVKSAESSSKTPDTLNVQSGQTVDSDDNGRSKTSHGSTSSQDSGCHDMAGQEPSFQVEGFERAVGEAPCKRQSLQIQEGGCQLSEDRSTGSPDSGCQDMAGTQESDYRVIAVQVGHNLNDVCHSGGVVIQCGCDDGSALDKSVDVDDDVDDDDDDNNNDETSKVNAVGCQTADDGQTGCLYSDLPNGVPDLYRDDDVDSSTTLKDVNCNDLPFSGDSPGDPPCLPPPPGYSECAVCGLAAWVGEECGPPEGHQCLQALRSSLLAAQGELRRASARFVRRERVLLAQVATLQGELRAQASRLRFLQSQQRPGKGQDTGRIADGKPPLPPSQQQQQQPTRSSGVAGGGGGGNCEKEDIAVSTLCFSLLRHPGGSLGFNIMGGYTPDSNHKSAAPEGIVVSKVIEGGTAEKEGVRIQDRIVKVNGQDLSKASHEEAVEAFRAAREPIVVEVLRRTSAKPSASKMKNRSPTMVSIATQTEEDFYCYNRPPTPPPGFYPINISGLYQPSSRRPVAFSPSAEMGLTDIEMAHGLDYDDTYFDDRHYEMEYEEVVLHRSSSDEKLGLTLCYGSADDEQTDIFISEVDPSSSAAKDGRIREGDQILQINGVDVHTRDQAIRLFSEPKSDIVLLVARPQLQCDDGFMEEPNLVLDDLHMDLLEKQHHDNMQFMASMLARRHVDEEGGTTDTATTENSAKHEKDSGVGRTDESTRNDESSEQENFDCESMSALVGAEFPEEIPAEACREFRHVLERRCLRVGGEANGLGGRKDSESSIERELALLNREMEEIQLECQEIVDAHSKDAPPPPPHVPTAAPTTQPPSPPRPAPDTQRSPRVVPRMGTRLEYMKHLPGIDPSELWLRRSVVTGVRSVDVAMTSSSASGSLGNSASNAAPSGSSSSSAAKAGAGATTGEKGEKDTSTTSAYNTGDSCRSTPLMLELNSGSDDADRGFKNSMLCLATPTNPPTVSPPSVPPSSSDTEKQTQTPTKARDYSSDESGVVHHKVAPFAHAHGPAARILPPGGRSFVGESIRAGLQDQVGLGESLQDLYMRYADVMYTNRANLEHTIAIQQKLFQQQMEQQARFRHKGKAAASSAAGESSSQLQAASVPSQPSDSGQMEWVVKRRPDGTRYITRRPVRNKLLKERAKKLEEERCGMTTDDDAMSELKTGRYWTKEERKRHLEKARDYKRRKETMIKARMETLKESEEKKEVNIVELSHRKMMKHKGKKVFDDFVTVQEMLAHGSRVSQGKTYNPLLSVTTV